MAECVMLASALMVSDVSARFVRGALDRAAARAVYDAVRGAQDIVLTGSKLVFLSRTWAYLTALSGRLEYKIKEKLKITGNFHSPF